MARRPTRVRHTSINKSAKSGGLIRGEEGRRRVEEEAKKADDRRKSLREGSGNIQRLWIKPGTSKEVIILDDAPEFFRYEHCLKNPRSGRFDLFCGCIKETDICPVCEEDKESYYAMYLTALDFFTDKDGNDTFRRKLICAKSGAQKKFLRRYNKEGTLRGAVFDLIRDAETDPSVGGDIEFLEFVDEEELAEYINVWKDRQGKTHKEDCSVPFDYPELFPAATIEHLSRLVGASPSIGSRRYVEEELEDEADDSVWENDEEEKPKNRVGRRRTSNRDDSPRSNRSTRSNRRSAKPTTRRKETEEEIEEELEEEEIEELEEELEEEPKPRARTKARVGRSRR